MAEPSSRATRLRREAERARLIGRAVQRRIVLPLLGAVVIAGAGWISFSNFGLRFPWGEKEFMVSFRETLERLSYDLSFAPALRLKKLQQKPEEVCLLYMDDKAAKSLGQRAGLPWDRGVHARLVRKLTELGARAVFFDVVFADPALRPEADDEFVAAVKENGHVFLGAAMQLDRSDQSNQEQVFPPMPKLRRVAAGWGAVAFRPIDADYGVRHIYTGPENVPTATWRMAAKFGAALPEEDDFEARAQPRWLKYYGRVGCLTQQSYDRALLDNLPPDTFKDKFVFVGGRTDLGYLRMDRDAFAHPFTRWNGATSPGLEVHATMFLNLLRHEWLTRLDKRWEDGFVLIFGALLGALLPLFRPSYAGLIGALAIVLVIAIAQWLFWARLQWSAWCIPAFVQAPLAVVWAIAVRFLLEERRSKALRSAFSQYLSPHMAEKIAASQFNLKPGGVVVRATIMFTDLEGFTSFSEKLKDPVLITEVLTEYFTEATRHVLGQDGTILKFIGDAVLAIWGAPLPDAKQALHALTAAWDIQSNVKPLGKEGVVLRTRIGLHTGEVLAGNLGSQQRFDYTIIGDPANLASRLEGLNKHLKTNILLSEATRQGAGDAFRTRNVGEFRVEGRTESVTVHELLGPRTEDAPPDWLATFTRGLAQFQARDFSAARTTMEEVSLQRGENDGPAEFYRKKIDQLTAGDLPPVWDGVIELSK